MFEVIKDENRARKRENIFELDSQKSIVRSIFSEQDSFLINHGAVLTKVMDGTKAQYVLFFLKKADLYNVIYRLICNCDFFAE